MKLGSLFDGSGGFPLAGTMNGIEPVWASEIEPYPIRVTKLRFPQMKHLGDVTKVDGTQIEPVDIITFGSPCQDLSVAGKQAGIHEGQRSNLFFEAIRIIKEMRNATADEFPRWAVWENVPGAFSSNKGEDFRAVLEAFCNVREGADVSIPIAPNGRWTPAGCVVGEGFSVAWRVYDAQYWGVPQRRKRIYLVADFGGERAGEILFEREGVRGDTAPCGEARQGTASDAEGSAGGSGAIAFGWANASGAGLSAGIISPTIKSTQSGQPALATFMGRQGAKARSIAYCDDGTTPTLRAAPSGGSTVPDICYALKGNYIDRDTKQNGGGWNNESMYTLDATDRHGVCFQNTGQGWWNESPIGQTLRTGGEATRANLLVARCKSMSEYDIDGTCSTLKARDFKGGAVDVVTQVTEVTSHRKYIVRRMTPLECCRLQGFPDWWEDGGEGSDSARYKMWGNGVSLPTVVDVLGRIAKAKKDE
ncbi:MAG: DNA cytosine methyltransferase [Clostridia bacterium]|nr:DNA cytosine methyltransferase [Clostridia bacterium]